jgi:hypothetical protein
LDTEIARCCSLFSSKNGIYESKRPDDASSRDGLETASLLVQSVRKSGVAPYVHLFAWLNRLELSLGHAGIFSGVPVGMFVFIAVRTIEIVSFADANMAA